MPNARREKFLKELEEALAELQPALRVIKRDHPITIEGMFSLQSPDGPIDTYQIRIELNDDFPNVEPVVFETGNRIPKLIERHVNPGGNCCIRVWESWLATAKDQTFRAYLTGPIQEFFLNQFFYEQTGKWRLGDALRRARDTRRQLRLA